MFFADTGVLLKPNVKGFHLRQYFCELPEQLLSLRALAPQLRWKSLNRRRVVSPEPFEPVFKAQSVSIPNRIRHHRHRPPCGLWACLLARK